VPVGLALPAVLRLMLALVLAVWALTNVADRGGPHAGQASFGAPVRVRPVAVRLIPVLAMGVGIGLLRAASAWPAAIGAVGLLIVFAVPIVALEAFLDRAGFTHATSSSRCARPCDRPRVELHRGGLGNGLPGFFYSRP
jgi:hypothetical protein